MKPIIVVLILVTLVVVHSAPALLTQQYLLITPEAQLHLAPALKLQQSILQPITQIKKFSNLQNGENQDILLYYPNTPLVQYPTVLPLRQNFPSWDGFVQAVQDFFQQEQDENSDESEQQDTVDSKKISKLEFENDAETISPSAAPPSSAPAPIPNLPIIPTLNGHRFYVIGGEPQFYGNFAGLNNPTNPLYAFQPILTKGRSVDTGNEAESSENIDRASLLDVEAMNSAVKALNPAEPRFQSKYPAALIEDKQNSAVELEGKAENFQKGNENDPSSATSGVQNLKVSDDPSVARAGPEGIAIAGKGGLATSYPLGTALVGKGGLALSSPSATSIAGDFLGIDKA